MKAKGHTKPLIVQNYAAVLGSPSISSRKSGQLVPPPTERKPKPPKLYFAFPDGTAFILYPSIETKGIGWFITGFTGRCFFCATPQPRTGHAISGPRLTQAPPILIPLNHIVATQVPLPFLGEVSKYTEHGTKKELLREPGFRVSSLRMSKEEQNIVDSY